MKASPSLLASMAALALSVSAARAGDVTIPNEFQANTPASAAEVNENFESVATAVNDNNARIISLGAATSSLDAEVGNLEINLYSKITRTGDTMTGNLTVPKVVYLSPRTHTACISGDLFRPRRSTAAYASSVGNGGAYITTPSSTETMIAQVSIPDGATITGVTFYFYDNDATNDLKASANLQSFSGGYWPLGPIGTYYPSTGASPTTQAVSMAPSNNNVVHNTNGAITVAVLPAADSVWSSALAIRGVAFTYSLPEAQ